MLTYVFVAVLSLAVLFLSLEWSVIFGKEPTPGPQAVRLLSSRELSLYDGQEGSKGLYLAVLGQVFDVQTGHKHYGPGGAYHFMAGLSYICPHGVYVAPDKQQGGRPIYLILLTQYWPIGITQSNMLYVQYL